MEGSGRAFERLVVIMDELREQCPWDKKQTVETLRSMTIEETYELADAIIGNDWQGIREELGDLLLHIVFYARIGREQQKFTLEQVINGICDKLVKRHPHIYGDVKVENEEDVKRNWEKLKLKEGKKSVLSGLPAGLPSMVKAMRLQEKASQVGFEWDHREQVWEKVREELDELQQAVKELDAGAEGMRDRVEEELGDVFFSLVNYARFLQLDAERSLEMTNRKFISRFQEMESMALEQGKDFLHMSLQEMDQLWNSVKKKMIR